jgi:ketosteroid isomerase-like protein
MSENLDLVRSIYADWERGDFSLVEWAHPEIEYAVVEGPNPGSRTGLAGAVQMAREYQDLWEDYRVEAEEYRELDGERIVVFVRASGRGKASGVEIGQERAHVLHVCDGKVVKLIFYWNRDRALGDLGLKE